MSGCRVDGWWRWLYTGRVEKTGGKVLVVEDDRNLLDVLEYNLSREGYAVVTAASGARALELARTEAPDMLILDVMLPDLSGFEVCRILRQESNVPVLMLTARGEEVDRVVGLEIGADDYMSKPFSMRELLARVRAMLRRSRMAREKPSAVGAPVRVNDLEIDPARHRATLGGGDLDLNFKEFELLMFLAQNRGLVFSRDQLLDRVWGYERAVGTRTVDVHIRWLREKIEVDARKPRRLITVRGVGYKLEG